MPRRYIKGQGLDQEHKKERSTASSVSIKDLVEAGCHFGHQVSRWNPKMKRFIFGERNGLYIIDLAKTKQQLESAIEVATDVIAKGKNILFVGTKKQAKEVVRELAIACEQFYVCERWLGGMLTNLTTIRKSVKTLENIEKRFEGGLEGYKKKEVSLLAKSQLKLDRNLAGIRGMRQLPGMVFVVDPMQEHLAVAEAKRLGIPVMGIVDTNCNPDDIDHVIAANDDALKSIKLIVQAISDAIARRTRDAAVAGSKTE